ncbi:MAG TPA: Calx-beta domain-containing protein [Chitinispirillaceae bacterium]|nr:Calx-beta domain-containing protein [Chitinispirillaceae bacterium]
MIKQITGKWFLLLLLSVLIYVVCTEYPNPFQDRSLSKAAIGAKTFQNKDTVLIFSSETISVVTYLREHIKEVAVYIDNNRFWKSPDTVFYEEDLTAEPIIIPISFYQTGWKRIEITTTFKNDETKSETDSLFARSPLSQQSISAMAGDSIHLKTEPVKDDDVRYVWDFNDGMAIKEYEPQVDFLLKNSLSSPVGKLYVEDRKNNKSPSVYFSIIAESKLNVTSANDLMQGDTIYTGESNFSFKVYINGDFKNAYVNNLFFDSRQVSGNGFQLSKTFSKLDTLSSPMKASVKVIDKNNETIEKTFFIKYDENQTTLPEIFVNVPSTIHDTSFVMDSILRMSGNVTGHAQYEKLYLNFSLNGFAMGHIMLLAENNKWTYKLNLVAGWNKVRLDVSKDSTIGSSVLVAKEIQIKYDSTMYDAQPPEISDIKVDDVAVAGDKRFTSVSPEVILTMDVSDDKGIKSVTVNNDTAKVQQNGLTYSIKVAPEHKKDGTAFIIVATDIADHPKSDTVTGLLNHTPRIESVSLPSIMKTDSTYYFIVKASDGDAGDKLVKTITVKRPGGDSTITIVNDTVIWKPALADTGKNTIYIHVVDDFFHYDDATIVSTVYQKTDKPLKVSWLTTPDDFPDSIVVGKEQLTGQLKVDPGTGIGPFTYTISMDNPYKLIYEGSEAQIFWSPTRSDAGLRTLHFIVKDKNGDSDTLDALMNIIAHPAAVVYLVEQSMILNENSGDSSTKVRLSAPLADTVRIPYSIKLNSAASQDLDMVQSGSVLFVPGDTIVRLPVNIINDNQIENDEQFIIQLSDLPALSDKDSIALNKNRSKIEVTIRDDDMRTVKYSFDGSAGSGSEKTLEYKIKVTLDTTYDRDLELTCYLDYSKSSANDSDFSFASKDTTLKFAVGDTVAEFKISITNDTKSEKDEVLVFKLKANDTALVAGTNTSFQYTIIDDDAYVKVGVMLQPAEINDILPEGAAPSYPAVVLTEELPNDITVTVRAKESSTARANSDYSIVGNNIVVKVGTKMQSLGLKIIKDLSKEPQEFVEFEIINISDTVHAEISQMKTSRVKIAAN